MEYENGIESIWALRQPLRQPLYKDYVTFYEAGLVSGASNYIWSIKPLGQQQNITVNIDE